MNRPNERSAGPLEIMARLASAQALIACTLNGLLDSLVRDPADTVTLSDRHELDPGATRRVLDVLAADGLIVERDGAWSASDNLRAATKDLPQNLSAFVGSLVELPEHLRTGRPAANHRERQEYSDGVEGLHRLFEAAAGELAARLTFDISTVLDLGTGSGVFGIAVARHHGVRNLVGVDSPEVLEVFEWSARREELCEVASALPADFLQADLPQGFDCTLICNVLRILRPADARALIHRAARTIGPEGRVVIVDVMGEDPPERQMRRSLYRLDLALRVESGGPHLDEEITGWLEESGLRLEHRFRLASSPLGEEAIVATHVSTDGTE